MFLEALHKNDYTYFLKSPEWGIATIFLSFQGTALYIKALTQSGKKINYIFLGLLLLAVIFIVIASILNSYMSLNSKEDNLFKQILRMFFLLVSMIYFLLLGMSAHKIENK